MKKKTQFFKKFFRRSPRRLSSNATNFIAAILSGISISVFFSLVWIGPSFTNWEKSIIRWIIYGLFTIIFLIFYYWIGIKFSCDIKERRNFHDNFFIGIFSSTIVALGIIFHLFIKENIMIIPLLILVTIVLFFLFIFVLFRIRRPKE